MDKFLEQFRASLGSNAAIAPAVTSTLKEDYDKPFLVEPQPNISGSITQELNFDNNGDAYFSITKYMAGVTVHLSATIKDLGAIFDIWLDSNYPEHFEWHGVLPNQRIDCALKTNRFSSTTIKIRVHSSVPNSRAIAVIGYST